MTWDELVEREPRLAAVERLALGFGRRRGRGVDWSEYEYIKRRAGQLVGWGAENEQLSSPECYDGALRHLLFCWERGIKPEPGQRLVAHGKRRRLTP